MSRAEFSCASARASQASSLINWVSEQPSSSAARPASSSHWAITSRASAKSRGKSSCSGSIANRPCRQRDCHNGDGHSARRFRSSSASCTRSRWIARCKLTLWSRRSLASAMIPLAKCFRTTADAVLLRCWPPGPPRLIRRTSHAASNCGTSRSLGCSLTWEFAFHNTARRSIAIKEDAYLHSDFIARHANHTAHVASTRKRPLELHTQSSVSRQAGLNRSAYALGSGSFPTAEPNCRSFPA